MFNPEKDDYPQNAAGKAEFASITLTIDSVVDNPALGEDVVQKLVLSTQDAIAALVAQAAYFGEPHMFAEPRNAHVLVEAGRCDDPVFVYSTPRAGTIQVITSTPTWDALVQHPDFGGSSALVAGEKLKDIVADEQAKLQQFSGGFASLILLDLSPATANDMAASQSASSEGGPGHDAESLVRTADVVEQD